VYSVFHWGVLQMLAYYVKMGTREKRSREVGSCYLSFLFFKLEFKDKISLETFGYVMIYFGFWVSATWQRHRQVQTRSSSVRPRGGAGPTHATSAQTGLDQDKPVKRRPRHQLPLQRLARRSRWVSKLDQDGNGGGNASLLPGSRSRSRIPVLPSL
jgi:hypothetical protein